MTEPMNPLVAFQGEVEVLNATWSLNDGRRLELRICGNAYERQHPFKRFQQKRNGHVGTRFKASFARTSTGECVGLMELMLAGWKDSSSIGQSVTFWLDDEPTVHPFCGCQPRKAQVPGDMFALVLVEINDDEQPIDQVRRARVDSAGMAGLPGGSAQDAGPRTKAARAEDMGEARPGLQGDQADSGPNGVSPRGSPGGGNAAVHRPAKKLSSSAHLLLTSPMFVQYLKETKPNLVKTWTPEIARQYAKRLIEVESLGDLDRDRAAVERFQNLVRKPFDKWHYQTPP